MRKPQVRASNDVGGNLNQSFPRSGDFPTRNGESESTSAERKLADSCEPIRPDVRLFRLRPRVRCAVTLLETCRRDVRVNLRRDEALVPEEFLHAANIGTGVE